MIKVESVNHMSIAVNNLEKSRKWYMDLLGLEEIIDNRTRDFPPGFKLPPDPLFTVFGNQATKHPCRLACGGLEITLFERPAPVDPASVTSGRGVFHYSYRMDFAKVKSLCDDTEALRRKGYQLPFEPQPLVLPDGTVYLRLYLLDPDGNLMEIVGWPPMNARNAAGKTGHAA